jgi:hypothetical protein
MSPQQAAWHIAGQKRVPIMLRSGLLCLFVLVPFVARAETHIYVEYVVRQERVSPQPQIVRPRLTQHFILRDGGTVDAVSTASGRYPDRFQSSTRLGKDQFRVVNQRTISRTWSLGAQRRTLTVTTDGKGCRANLAITGSTEFQARSTDLNQMALYRNTQVESITCRIE